MKHSKEGQAWSIDLIIGLLVFVLIMVIFYSLIGGEKESKVSEFTDKADFVAQRLFQKGLVDPVTGEFDEAAFLSMASDKTYEELKEELGITGDFCLFLETTDANPTVKFIADDSGQSWSGIGSPDLEIGGYECGTQTT